MGSDYKQGLIFLITKKNKRMFKSVLRLILRRSWKNIIQCIDLAEVISFDLFDTLITRNGKKPEEVFDIVKKECINYPQNRNYIMDRIIAEHKARKCKGGEVTLEQIYECLEWGGEEEKQKLKELEIDTELSLSKTNAKGKMLYDYALKTNKTIVITTDMYLPLNVIIDLMKKNGYSNWSSVVLSSEYGISKNHGLYRVLADKYKKNKMIHIGDDVITDFFSAKKQGIQAILL